MLPLIIAAIAGITALVVIACLCWDDIINWFRDREELKQSDADNIAFTLQEKLKDGKYKTVEGIFNKRTNEMVDGKKYESEEIDEELAKVHQRDALVIYE